MVDPPAGFDYVSEASYYSYYYYNNTHGELLLLLWRKLWFIFFNILYNFYNKVLFFNTFKTKIIFIIFLFFLEQGNYNN